MWYNIDVLEGGSMVLQKPQVSQQKEYTFSSKCCSKHITSMPADENM
jgi:hypothetical protein